MPSTYSFQVRRLLVALLPFLSAACGSVSPETTKEDKRDAGAGDVAHPEGGDSGGMPPPGTDVGPCSPGCPANSTCYYPIGSCSAAARCIVDPSPNTPECGALEELCGCDGGQVVSGCGFPGGYASGPTTGASFCGDAGGPVDAGPTFPCGTLGQKCGYSDQYCMLYDGTVASPSGGTGTEGQCSPIPDNCGSTPTCACVESAVYPASSVTGCSESDGGITVNVTQ
jgi:hypothetical protein